MNHLKTVTNGILPRDEQNTARRQKLFIVNELLENKCTNYVNTDIYYLSPDGDWIRENGCLDICLFYKDKLHLIEKEYRSSNINEVITAVLNLFLFLTKDFTCTKSTKSTKSIKSTKTQISE